jgi:hypothetical protein
MKAVHEMAEVEKKSKIAKKWKKLKQEIRQAHRKGMKVDRSGIPLNCPPST